MLQAWPAPVTTASLAMMSGPLRSLEYNNFTGFYRDIIKRYSTVCILTISGFGGLLCETI